MMNKFDWMKICLLAMTFLLLLGFSSCETAPEPLPTIPTPTQMAWQKLETYAFVHFGLNTFNDLEWGYGDTPAVTFNPVALDCEQWVLTFKACGMKAVILTAKHHDGFCLWPTATTDYNIANSPYKDGQGDLVRELSEACRKHGLQFGLYLSPWDRNNAEYGREAYVETYHKQIEELTSNYGPLFEFWFDGANGGDGWYGGVDETRSIDAATYYDYERARKTIHARHPEAMIFGGTVPTIRWVGNEQGWAGETMWSTLKMSQLDDADFLSYGSCMGDRWLPAEVDVSIRPGWFYHAREDHQVKTVAQLVDIYYKSVGHNANLLLNFPIDLNGKIAPNDSANAVQWHKVILQDFDDNLLKNCKIEASSFRSKKFQPENVLSEDDDAYWATGKGLTKAELVFVFPETTTLNRVMLQEYIPLGQRVEQFALERFVNGKWLPIETDEVLTTIGYKRIVRFKTLEMNKLRIRFKRAKGEVCINKVGAYYAETLLTEPEIKRDFNNMVSMSTADENAVIRYTIDGSEPNCESLLYKASFELKDKAIVKAISCDPVSGKQSAVAVKEFDLPTTAFKVFQPSDESARRMFDGDEMTSYYLSRNKNFIELHLNQKMKIAGVRYLPSQARDAVEHVAQYEVYVDGKMVSKGAFANIVNNPIEQEVRFAPVEGKTVLFVAVGNTHDAPRAAVAEFSVVTE